MNHRPLLCGLIALCLIRGCDQYSQNVPFNPQPEFGLSDNSEKMYGDLPVLRLQDPFQGVQGDEMTLRQMPQLPAPYQTSQEQFKPPQFQESSQFQIPPARPFQNQQDIQLSFPNAQYPQIPPPMQEFQPRPMDPVQSPEGNNLNLMQVPQEIPPNIMLSPNVPPVQYANEGPVPQNVGQDLSSQDVNPEAVPPNSNGRSFTPDSRKTAIPSTINGVANLTNLIEGSFKLNALGQEPSSQDINPEITPNINGRAIPGHFNGGVIPSNLNRISPPNAMGQEPQSADINSGAIPPYSNERTIPANFNVGVLPPNLNGGAISPDLDAASVPSGLHGKSIPLNINPDKSPTYNVLPPPTPKTPQVPTNNPSSKWRQGNVGKIRKTESDEDDESDSDDDKSDDDDDDDDNDEDDEEDEEEEENESHSINSRKHSSRSKEDSMMSSTTKPEPKDYKKTLPCQCSKWNCTCCGQIPFLKKLYNTNDSCFFFSVNMNMRTVEAQMISPSGKNIQPVVYNISAPREVCAQPVIEGRQDGSYGIRTCYNTYDHSTNESRIYSCFQVDVYFDKLTVLRLGSGIQPNRLDFVRLQFNCMRMGLKGIVTTPLHVLKAVESLVASLNKKAEEKEKSKSKARKLRSLVEETSDHENKIEHTAKFH